MQQQNKMRQIYSDQLVPITSHIGHLKSNIIEGIEKYYNKYADEAQNVLRSRSSNPLLKQLVNDLLSRRPNYCIRQKLSLEELLQYYTEAQSRLC